VEELVKNKTGIQVLTDSGWSDFEGLMIMGERDTVVVILEDGSKIQCTPDHKIYTEGMVPVQAHNLTQHHRVITGDSVSKVVSVDSSTAERVYDIHKVKNNRRFIADNILVSNCEFIIYDETLISPIRLLELAGADPKIKTNTQIRWYQTPNPDHIFSVSLDPSAGTGGDNAAIQVVDVSTMTQVAEWCHNRTPVEGQMKILMDILMFLRNYGCSQIYWSVENNSIGEAVLVVIRDTGEETFPGEFIHDPNRVPGKRGRKGFHTGHRSKMEACLKFKRLLENGKLVVHSRPLISELKNFVSRGRSFSAKPGETDDLVMSMLINIRMIEYIGSFEDQVYDSVNSSLGNDLEDEDDYDGPMPMGII